MNTLIRRSALLLAGATLIFQCNLGTASMSLTISATNQVKTTFLQKIKNYLFAPRLYALDLGNNVIVTDLRISVERIKFKLPNEAPALSEIYYVGPYIIDLLDDNSPLKQALGTVEIEQGNYTGIRLLFRKTTSGDPAHKLYNRSIYMAGTIAGVPFEMWHDTGENLDVDPPGGFSITGGSINEISIDFKLASLLENLDISGAADGDGDGIIEINPDDTDNNNGNNVYADALKERIKIIADLLD